MPAAAQSPADWLDAVATVTVQLPHAIGHLHLPKNNTRTIIPWVWYAPSQGLAACNDWIVRQLLGHGVALAHMNVGESGGSPKSRRTFQAFYESLVGQHSMAAKPVLWPQSRGGLMLYNWAVEHPGCVQAVAGTYTVCNLEEWTITPHAGIQRLYAAALEDYELTTEQLLARLKEHNPIDRLQPLVDAGVPILHIHGDKDDVVPLAAHAGELVKRYQALGGDATLISVHNKGHEEAPEFFQSRAFVDFLLEQAEASIEPSAS